MKRLMIGWAFALFVSSAPPAAAEPSQADLWIGVDGTLDGFLLNMATGELWMTGVCLKALDPARREGTLWRADLFEMVSVGRGHTLLEQSFVLETNEDAPSITVMNANRGGEQAIPGITRVMCTESDLCARASASPSC